MSELPANPALRDLLPVPLLILDGGRRIAEINAAAARLLEITPEEAEGAACQTVFRCEECREECAIASARERRLLSLSRPAHVEREQDTTLRVLVDAMPLSGDRVAVVLHPVAENTPLEQIYGEVETFHGLIWISPAMKSLVGWIIDHAPGDAPLLISGERGTEKGIVARALHSESGRAGGPFVTVDCASEADGLPGGSAAKRTLGASNSFEQARGGTLFLRNLTYLPREVQGALFRRLDTRRGATSAQDPRLIGATDSDPDATARSGALIPEFHEVLRTHRTQVPPLRNRLEDLPALAHRILSEIAARTGLVPAALTGDVTAVLLAHNWPGNVEELEGVLHEAASQARGGIVRRGDLPAEFLPDGWVGKSERARTHEALHKAAGNISLAARMLGVHRITLWRRMRVMHLSRRDFLPR